MKIPNDNNTSEQRTTSSCSDGNNKKKRKYQKTIKNITVILSVPSSNSQNEVKEDIDKEIRQEEFIERAAKIWERICSEKNKK